MTEEKRLGSRVVLVVEDEVAIRYFIRDTLRRQGITVVEADNVAAALAAAGTQHPDLVLLDLGLARSCGQDFIAAYRRWSQRPILILSARQGEQDKVAALDAGADDYLVKPFSVAELLARLRALLRRAESATAADLAQFSFGEVVVDLGRQWVTRRGQAVHLSATEFQLLATLLGNAGKVLTHQQLLRQVWGPGHSGDSHYLRVFVGRLRQKLERDPALPEHLLTEIGVGYRFLP